MAVRLDGKMDYIIIQTTFGLATSGQKNSLNDVGGVQFLGELDNDVIDNDGVIDKNNLDMEYIIVCLGVFLDIFVFVA